MFLVGIVLLNFRNTVISRRRVFFVLIESYYGRKKKNRSIFSAGMLSRGEGGGEVSPFYDFNN